LAPPRAADAADAALDDTAAIALSVAMDVPFVVDVSDSENQAQFPGSRSPTPLTPSSQDRLADDVVSTVAQGELPAGIASGDELVEWRIQSDEDNGAAAVNAADASTKRKPPQKPAIGKVPGPRVPITVSLRSHSNRLFWVSSAHGH
jgi:hypothetical protein